jgi:hypothetical protein
VNGSSLVHSKHAIVAVGPLANNDARLKYIALAACGVASSLLRPRCAIE